MPDNGEEIIAQRIAPEDAIILKTQPGLCGKGKHKVMYIACVTQWGFVDEMHIVFMRCKRCKETWAYKVRQKSTLPDVPETALDLETAPAV